MTVPEMQEPETMRWIHRPADSLKAYRLTELDEESSCVVMAHTESEALLMGENTFNSACTVARDPQYDSYAEQGYVPLQRLTDDRWWHSCSFCGEYVQKDAWADDERVYVIDGENIFCDAEHHRLFQQRIQARLDKKAEAVAAAEARWPGVRIVEWLSGGDNAPGRLVLEAPTLVRERVNWTPGQTHVIGIGGAVAGFIQWAGTVRVQEETE
jgi:hypothetical protein